MQYSTYFRFGEILEKTDFYLQEEYLSLRN